MPYDTTALKGLAVSDNGLVFDPMTGSIFTTNPVGLKIIEALRKGHDNDRVKEAVVKEFDIDAETADRDIFEFATQLSGYGLIKDKVEKTGKKK